MVIDHLNIKAYKGVRSFEMTPGKINVLAGKIGAGKSSVLEAVRFAVTGVADTESIPTDVTIKLFSGKEIQRT